MQKEKKGWCDRQIHSEGWCDKEVADGVNTKTLDDKSLYEGPTKAQWQIDGSAPPKHDKYIPETLAQKQDWCDSGIKGTNWCDQEESKDLNERTKQQKGLMFVQREYDDNMSASEKRDWCDSGIKGTNWCAQEEAKDLNERTKQQQGLMFLQKNKKDWCDRQIHSDAWCDKEVADGLNTKTLDDKSLYEGPTKAQWQIDGSAPPKHDKYIPESLVQKQDWCDSGIKGTNWCAQEEAKDLNERTKQQQGLMFAEREYNDAITPQE